MTDMKSRHLRKKAHTRLTAMIGAVVMGVTLLTGCGEKWAGDKAQPGTFTEISVQGDISFDYQLYTPEDGKNMPLVIVFHGYGEGKNLLNCKIPTTLSSSESQAVRPCYIMAPVVDDNVYLISSDRDKMYSALMTEAETMISKGKVDKNRIYVMGNSFGGLGTVEFTEKFPDKVAAAVPMCPALSYDDNSNKNLPQMKDVPVWFLHARNDNVISTDVSSMAVYLLQMSGAKDVHLTQYTDEEMLAAGALTGFHQADFAAMEDEEVLQWLFNTVKK